MMQNDPSDASDGGARMTGIKIPALAEYNAGDIL